MCFICYFLGYKWFHENPNGMGWKGLFSNGANYLKMKPTYLDEGHYACEVFGSFGVTKRSNFVDIRLESKFPFD